MDHSKKDDSKDAFTQLSDILFDTKQSQQKFLELAMKSPKHAINKELGSGNMSFFKGLYAMKLAVIMNAHQLYQQTKKQKVSRSLPLSPLSRFQNCKQFATAKHGQCTT